jgi:hypothetical protein
MTKDEHTDAMLRQFAVDKALSFVAIIVPHVKVPKTDEVLGLAQQIYDFTRGDTQND